MKRSLITLAVLAMLTGCGTFNGLTFENRVACTVARDKAFLVSEWGGRIGITGEIAEADRAVICGKTP
jgi:hypothetical protein